MQAMFLLAPRSVVRQYFVLVDMVSGEELWPTVVKAGRRRRIACIHKTVESGCIYMDLSIMLRSFIPVFIIFRMQGCYSYPGIHDKYVCLKCLSTASYSYMFLQCLLLATYTVTIL